MKSDTSLLFKKLNELNSVHRIIMTGVRSELGTFVLYFAQSIFFQTPLNNNIRELFNLMNFLDPDEWNDLEALEKEHEELTEDLVKQLHNRLRPYFLRRLKSEVLQLPPKVRFFRHRYLYTFPTTPCRTKSLYLCPWHLCRNKFIGPS